MLLGRLLFLTIKIFLSSKPFLKFEILQSLKKIIKILAIYKYKSVKAD